MQVAPGPRRTSPGTSASPPPTTAVCAPARSGSRSTRCSWLPLHATCTDQTSPWRNPKPASPTVRSKRRVGAGAAAATGAHERAVGDAVPLRDPLVHPAAGEVEHLVGPGRQWQERPQGGQLQGRLARGRRRGHHRARRSARRAHRGRRSARRPRRPRPPRPGRRTARPLRRRVAPHRGAADPPARWTAIPGVPSQPSAEVGSTVRSQGSSRALWAAGPSRTRSRSVRASSDRSAPQCSTAGRESPSCTRTRQAPPPRSTVVVGFTPSLTPG